MIENENNLFSWSLYRFFLLHFRNEYYHDLDAALPSNAMASSTFLCSESGLIIDALYRQDGQYDCPDGEDEEEEQPPSIITFLLEPAASTKSGADDGGAGVNNDEETGLVAPVVDTAVIDEQQQRRIVEMNTPSSLGGGGGVKEQTEDIIASLAHIIESNQRSGVVELR